MSEMLFLTGLSLVGLSLLVGVVVLIVQLSRKKKLESQLNREYGEKNKA